MGVKSTNNSVEFLDRAEKLREGGLRFRVHAEDDDKWNEAVMGNYFGLLRRPRAPLLYELGHCRHSSVAFIGGCSLLRVLSFGL
ncbi:mitochondrial import receptor subunit tom7-1 [Nicotiana attenuata]|uniref:Mitochondrial import receptor subunit tom7-1 n=1 Tax=Nicotiana attenuata TaxID=49451 RepID=A0A1J6IS50_NICAT|nr:mitochondrial import receptor subunit tom7-1 [Nicotiana attenuata]